MKWILKTSTVRVATREHEGVYQSLDEMPAELRRKLRASLDGPNAHTIYITNKAACDWIADLGPRRNEPASFASGKPKPVAHRFYPSWKWILVAGGSTIGGLSLILLWLILDGKS